MSVFDYESAAAHMAKARNPRRGRPLGNNTRLIETADGYGVMLHETVVVEYLPSGNVRLRSGHWRSVTTQKRIRDYSPTSVGQGFVYDPATGEKLSPWQHWVVGNPIGHTAPKVQKCRRCHGTGETSRTDTGAWNYEARTWETYPEPKIVTSPCGACGETGRRDYGTKPIFALFYEGIEVDPSGNVVSELRGIDGRPLATERAA